MVSVRLVFHNYGEKEGVDHNVGAYGEDECVFAVRISRVCVVCYSTHHRVMSQARDDYEGFLKAHMTEEEKVIVHVETSLSV